MKYKSLTNKINILSKKNILQLLLILLSFSSFSQIIDYENSSLLFSKENLKGTARYTAMSGAFGALGGDLSAVDVNPAGLVVFNNSETVLTLGNNSTTTNSTFYNTSLNTSNDSFNLNQFGAVLVFENNSNYWTKVAIGFNYTITNNFDNSYLTSGTSPLTEFNEDPFLNSDTNVNNDVFYENVDSQKFNNITNGSISKAVFSIAGQYDDNTSYGLSMNTYSLDYFQQIFFTENSNDGNSNTSQAKLDQKLLIIGDGISFNFGVISKPTQNLRLGLAYQTPTWYNVTEEFEEDLEINLSNTNQTLFENPDFSVFEYQIRTSSKLTGSVAYIFGKKGLVSLDYTYRDYNNIKLKPSSEFSLENDNLNNLNGVSELKIGGEYRYKNISLRAGYHTESNPIKNLSTNKEGYSLGFGFKFSNTTKLDFSYDNTTSKDNYSFLNFVNPAEINTTNDRVMATITIGI